MKSISMKIYWICLLALLLGCKSEFAPEDEHPELLATAPEQSAYTSAEAIQNSNPPTNDGIAIFQRLSTDEIVAPQPRTEQVGDVVSFWYKKDGQVNTEISAELLYQSDQLEIWMEDGESVKQSTVEETARVIEEEILPTSLQLFGNQVESGIDNDPRITLLNIKSLGGSSSSTSIAGYFFSGDQLPTTVNRYSNERDMLYMNLKTHKFGTDKYLNTFAHEIQHLLHNNVDGNEEAWLDEGAAELSSYLNGYKVKSSDDFMEQPDLQLNDWVVGSSSDIAHYGASFLFMNYVHHHYGDVAIEQITANQNNGFHAISDLLKANNTNLGEHFQRWTATNYLTSHQVDGVENNAYTYPKDIELTALSLTASHDSFPVDATGGVSQFGTDYIEINSAEPVTLEFTGSQQVTTIDTRPHDGAYFWATVSADRSDMTLTKQVDLSAVDEATLSFWTWYDIEVGWDYGYILASTDGEEWSMLETIYSTKANNTSGNNYGVALTGTSGALEEPKWVQLFTDLSAFAGEEQVWIRFEYITDQAVNLGGWAIDEIEIPEINYQDSFEADTGDWDAEGFIRHTGIIPQNYLLQVIYLSEDGTKMESVETLDLTAEQTIKTTLPLNESTNQAILILSANSLGTTQRAGYEYKVTK